MLLEELFGPDIIGYDAPLELAKWWLLSRDRSCQENAATLLTELTTQYPLAIDIVQELALVLMEICPDQVQATLDRAMDTFQQPNEELLCRFGRLFKEKGDRHRGQGEYGPAGRAYHQAAQSYEESFNIRKGQYPGINLATLCLVQAGLARLTDFPDEVAHLRARSEELARRLLDSRRRWYDDQLGDRDLWHPATEAEARLLLQDWSEAAEIYRAIPTGRERDSMKRQVERILEAWRTLGVKDFGAFNRLAEVFP